MQRRCYMFKQSKDAHRNTTSESRAWTEQWWCLSVYNTLTTSLSMLLLHLTVAGKIINQLAVYTNSPHLCHDKCMKRGEKNMCLDVIFNYLHLSLKVKLAGHYSGCKVIAIIRKSYLSPDRMEWRLNSYWK